jgi:TatA/E family protein of Tat protein translocase
MGIENPVHLLFIAIVALVVLGPRRLPELARALGKGIREFRESISAEAEPEAGPPEQEAPPKQEAPTEHEAPTEQEAPTEARDPVRSDR